MAFLSELKRKKNIHVVGLSSIEGSTIIKFLRGQGITKITAHDFCPKENFEENFKRFNAHADLAFLDNLKRLVSKIHFKDSYLEGILAADLIFVPQAWYKYGFNYPALNLAQEKGIPFETMMGLYLKLAPCFKVGVTGSQGKTTTSKLITAILKEAGKEVYLVGNDRSNCQILDKILNLNKDATLVLEISNRQLKQPLGKSCNLAVITNIYPNHLDEHADFEDYAKTKLKILGPETKQAIVHFKTVSPFLKNKNKLKVDFFCFDLNPKKGADFYVEGSTIISKLNGEIRKEIDLAKTQLTGEHNAENILAAVATSKLLKISSSVIQKAVDEFSPIKGRLAKIAEINGVTYVDDTKSTTPTATKKAILSFKGPLTLIVGGNEKNLDYQELEKEISKRVACLIILPGTVAGKFPNLILKKKIKTSVFFQKTLEEALFLAKEKTPQGGVVIVSPAGEGFYTNFLLGKKLKDLVEG